MFLIPVLASFPKLNKPKDLWERQGMSPSSSLSKSVKLPKIASLSDSHEIRLKRGPKVEVQP